MRDNVNSTEKLLVTGKITDNGTPVKNTALTLKLNGTGYEITTDSYGEYIAAVDYPDGGQLSAAIDGYVGPAVLDIPVYDNMIKGADFTSTLIPAPLYEFEINGNAFRAECHDPDCEMFVVEYDADGRMLAVHKDKSDGSILSQTKETKAFAWKRGTREPGWDKAPTVIK